MERSFTPRYAWKNIRKWVALNWISGVKRINFAVVITRCLIEGSIFNAHSIAR